jgi:lipopolysaccharide export LptBFGC system permease protein LptF
MQPDAVYEHAMMSLLDRYILRELWPSFVLALVVATFVLFADKGISLGRMLVPLGAAAVVVYGLSSFVLMYVAPWGFQGLQRLFFEVARSRAYYHLQAREFNDTFKGLVL